MDPETLARVIAGLNDDELEKLARWLSRLGDKRIEFRKNSDSGRGCWNCSNQILCGSSIGCCDCWTSFTYRML